MAGQVRVFVASSLDGFIAGPGDELDWLAGRDGVEDTFAPFLAQIGAILMGRRTYDVVAGLDATPYQSTPLLVATTRPLHPDRPSARSLAGSIKEMVAAARVVAGERDVYLDGGRLIRSALEAGQVDDLVITIVPILLGHGVPLFAGLPRRHLLELVSHRAIGGGLIELRYRTLAITKSV